VRLDLTDRVALVTGAYRGLGFAIARGMAEAGATVILNGRKPDELAQAAKAIGANAGVAVFDVTDRASVEQGVAGIAARHGAVDILVNNAGIQRRAPFVEFRQQDWDDVIATNLTAPFVVSQAVLPAMIERKRG
jgi:gluconate 5-dehydrogenase